MPRRGRGGISGAGGGGSGSSMGRGGGSGSRQRLLMRRMETVVEFRRSHADGQEEEEAVPADDATDPHCGRRVLL